MGHDRPTRIQDQAPAEKRESLGHVRDVEGQRIISWWATHFCGRGHPQASAKLPFFLRETEADYRLGSRSTVHASAYHTQLCTCQPIIETFSLKARAKTITSSHCKRRTLLYVSSACMRHSLAY